MGVDGGSGTQPPAPEGGKIGAATGGRADFWSAVWAAGNAADLVADGAGAVDVPPGAAGGGDGGGVPEGEVTRRGQGEFPDARSRTGQGSGNWQLSAQPPDVDCYGASEAVLGNPGGFA